MNKRCIVIVLDGLGIGETEDVAKVRPQDRGANTLKSILNHGKDLKIPNLTRLGLLEALAYGEEKDYSNWDYSAFSRIRFAHYGADTFFGHHEIMGSKPNKPIPQRFNDTIESVYKALMESGYQVEKIGEDKEQILLVNKILTVADNIECDLGSAFNVTASLDHIPFEDVVKAGRIVRSAVKVPRVIAFAGRGINIERILEAKEYKGEYVGINAPKSGVYDNDYHCIHLGFGIDAQEQVPHLLSKKGIDTYLIGKVADIIENKEENTFSMVPTANVLEKVLELMDKTGFICANVQETDLSGHAQDVNRYASVLNIADEYIGKIIHKMTEEDVLMVIADHGNDPMIGHSKHTREYVPLLIYGQPLTRRGKIMQQDTLANVGATVCSFFECEAPVFGNAIII
ncbi:phosphopentomutase [Anaerocolumna xylanovorans]|uniref:Phosphopentomutase n=1 Tax=Anaerocolumna xylanovorans DSM 12503 TaxID=1121345 RepID=A0A1M7XY94_9FIRM|nr:phosphopentomutase [Anaerocolumna xylanovorans]SHO43936.1 Phosphopentomutase [Anaerocolumna xylanovorans DSM 12503]